MTRWDANTNQYIQNVTFPGRDPALLMDASLADPALFPNDLRAATAHGFRVIFEWLPDGSWRESAIADSDVILFYLETDRAGVKARAQRQLYETIHDLHGFDDPVILDRVVPLHGAFELLVAYEDGDSLGNALISEAYIGEYAVVGEDASTFTADVAPEGIVAIAEVYATEDADAIATAVAPEDVAVVGDVLFVVDADEVAGLVSPEDLTVSVQIYVESLTESLTAGVVGDDVEVVTVIVPHAQGDELSVAVTPEDIRVKRTN